MPLPLPDLDTRRWDDLVEEGRGLIPRYSPSWTDHNIHDPGVTLIELLAWLAEQSIYRVNRIPPRHYRKFLQLIGFGPEPPKPARVPISFTLAAGNAAQELPAGTTFATTTAESGVLQFRTLSPITVVEAQIAALRVFDGTSPTTHQTRQFHERLPIQLWGANPVLGATDPEKQPALWIGFDQPLPVGTPVSVWFQFGQHGAAWEDRESIAAEAQAHAEACVPIRPNATCPPGQPSSDPWCLPEGHTPETSKPVEDSGPPAHHSVRVTWEYYGTAGWQILDPDSRTVRDETRGFSLDGPVTVTLPDAMAPQTLDGDAQAHWYLRCRLESGQPDRAPLAHLITVNTVAAEQVRAIRSPFVVRSDAALPPDGSIVPGQRTKLLLRFDEKDTIIRLSVTSDEDAPDILILDFQPPAGGADGRLTLAATYVGTGTGLPDQTSILPEAPVALGRATVWTQQDDQVLRWHQRSDLDSSKLDDAHSSLDATTGRLTFGNGDLGRVVPNGSAIFATYDVTTGAAGNLRSGADWHLDNADDVVNQVLLNEDPQTVESRLATITNLIPATGGSDVEDVRHAAGRAAETLWAHERIIEICPPDRCDTLDSLEPSRILATTAPQRAVTLLDYERLALAVPGTHIRRARAWAGLDPSYPGLSASGTVTVVIVPELPEGEPQPSDELRASVQRYLDRRRTIGTRLIVVGPQYLEVRVRATVRAKPSTDTARVQSDLIRTLNQFLDPLHGGPDSRGWPFGRDVYRSEILHVVDATPGVDHVLSLGLFASSSDEQCGSLCLAPTWLVTPGSHEIEVIR